MNEKEKKSESTGVWKIYSSMKTKQIGTHTGIFSHHSRVFKKKRKNIELLLALFNVYLFGCLGNCHFWQYF